MELARSGLLYERLVELTGLSRDQVKLCFLRDVLAKRGRYPSVVESAFREDFPSVYRVIRWVNRDDHCALIRHLQRAEAWLVIDCVAPRLIGHVPILTLHDAIYCQRQDVQTVAGVFDEVFEDLRFRMALKCEDN